MTDRESPLASTTAADTTTITGKTSTSKSLQPYICETCGRNYRTKDSLTRHRHNHDSASQHVCAKCSLTFSRSDVLSRHVRIHHNGRKRSPRACLACRAAKVKCNAASPCSRCISSSQICRYETDLDDGHHSPVPGSRTVRQHLLLSSGSTSIREPADDMLEEDRISSISGSSLSISHCSGTDYEAEPAQTIAFGRLLGAIPTSPHILPVDLETVESIQEFESHTESTGITFDHLYASNPLSQHVEMPWPTRDEAPQPDGVWNNDYSDMCIDYFDGPTGNYANVLDDSDFSIPIPGLNGQDSLASQVVACTANSSRPVPTNSSILENISEFFVETPWMSNYSGEINYLPPSPKTPSLIRCLNTSLAKIPLETAQQKIIEDLVDFAFLGFPASEWDQEQRSKFWKTMSKMMEEAFLEPLARKAHLSGRHILEYFIDLYITHFSQLWPVFRRVGFDSDELPPPLYLILSAIGAMYSDKGGRLYGSMMIERILTVLLSSTCFYEGTINLSESILRFMLLTQISTLYFGRRKGFSRAQHLGNIIINQSRKINLFNEPENLWVLPRIPPKMQFEHFMHLETRKRIAFGVFRADTFMSAVLNTRPYMSSEEIHLRLPAMDEIWLNADITAWKAYLSASDRSSNMLYSDLARVSMDRSEAMPDLSLPEQDLILYSTQESVWRFCQDPEMFNRIMGSKSTEKTFTGDESSDGAFLASERTAGQATKKKRTSRSTSSPDSLDCSSRKMSDLKLDYDRTVKSLEKWKKSFAKHISEDHRQKNRYRLLNGRLLYHLSFLRLYADIGSLDRVTLGLYDPRQLDQAAVKRVYQWSCSEKAERALKQALSIRSLILKEFECDLERRAKFNILSLISLYHAAMVVWAYAGSHEAVGTNSPHAGKDSSYTNFHHLPIYRENSRSWLLCFVDLFGKMTLEWSGLSSFAETVAMMAIQPCPVPLSI